MAEALLRQANEKALDSQRAHVALEEYKELGQLYRFERVDMNRKIRAYAWMTSTLLIVIGYPLTLAVTNEGGEVDPRWASVIAIYGLFALALIGFLVCLGDNLVKSYGQFLKRKSRISKARAQLRFYFQQHEPAMRTVMPWRLAEPGGANEIGERPDPDLTGLQRRLPLYYSIWSLVKIVLAVFVIGVLFERSFMVSRESAIDAAYVVLFLSPVWVYFVSGMCLRYHKYVDEGEAISQANPFPRYSTKHLRGMFGALPSRDRTVSTTFGVLWVGAILTCTTLSVRHFMAADTFEWHLVAVASILFAFIVRFAETAWRTAHMRANDEPSPAGEAATESP